MEGKGEDINIANDARHVDLLRDALIERMRRAGIDVITDWQEAERVLARENGIVKNAIVEEYVTPELRIINDSFNSMLSVLTTENANNLAFQLGLPNVPMKDGGVQDKPLKLYGNKILAKQRKHGFSLEELRNLPIAVANPIAIFNNYNSDYNRSILTELRTKNGNFLVSVEVGEDADIDFNIVSSVFGKGDINIAEWLKKGYATYINNEKVQNFLLHHSAPIAGASAKSEPLSDTNVQQNIELSKLLGEKLYIRTKNFQNWFGNWEKDGVNSSKAVNENGEPLVVYHGTTNDEVKRRWNEKTKTYDTEHKPFSEFKNIDAGGQPGVGHFFTSSEENAAGYGNTVYPVYLNMRNPLVIDCKGSTYNSIELDGERHDTYEWAAIAQEKGFDGVIFKSIRDGVDYGALQDPTDEFVVFDSNQIKSVYNVGTYRRDRNNIYEHRVVDAPVINGVISNLSKKYHLPVDVVRDYSEGMDNEDLLHAQQAYYAIYRAYKENVRAQLGGDYKLSTFSHMFAEVKTELCNVFGNVDDLRQKEIQKAAVNQNAMKAAEEASVAKAQAEYDRLNPYREMSEAELDAVYLSAVGSDEALMRDVLNVMAERCGYDSSTEYQGMGAFAAPANPGFETDGERRGSLEDYSPDVNIEDIALGYSPQPDDYFNNPHGYMYDTPHGLESSRALNSAINAIRSGEMPKVKVYRAVPDDIKEEMFRNGDWVTPSLIYANNHGAARFGIGGYHIIEQEVPANHLWWDGNDINEWGYDDGQGYRYKNVLHNIKSDALITYDDKGNIIPPSQRFDERTADIRYMLVPDSQSPVFVSNALLAEGLTGTLYHSIPVTDQMRHDVMEGQPMFFRNGEHQAYGFVHNGTIYIDPRIATAETPLHEYTHLWAEVLRQRNPQEWANIVAMMKATPEVWNYVRQHYPQLTTDDQIADEALAQFSGKRGHMRLQELANGCHDADSILDRMRKALDTFWHGVTEFFGIHYNTKEEVADMILHDLLSQVNPLDYKKGEVEGFYEQSDEALSFDLINAVNGQRKLNASQHFIKDRNELSQDERETQQKAWRAVFQSLSEVAPSSDPSRHTEVPGYTYSAQKPLSGTNLGRLFGLEGQIDILLREINDKDFSKGEFVNRLAGSLGMVVSKDKVSRYTDEPVVLGNGDKVTIRISDHYANCVNFIIEHSNSKKNYGVVIRNEHGSRFFPNGGVNYLEVNYSKNSIDNASVMSRREFYRDILKGIQFMLRNGSLEELPFPDHLNASGVFKKPLDQYRREHPEMLFHREVQIESDNFKQWFGDWQNASQRKPVEIDLAKLQETFDSIRANEGRDLFKAWFREIQENEMKMFTGPEARRAGIEVVVQPPIIEREPEDWEIIGISFEAMISRIGEEYRNAIDFTLDGRIIERPQVEVSKVVDGNGRPLVVEHGTHADFTEFSMDKIGSNSKDNGLFGAGFYFGTKAPAWLDDNKGSIKRAIKLHEVPELRDIFAKAEPTKEDVATLSRWLKAHKDDSIVLYHGTDSSLPILQEGLKKTTMRSKRSLQSGTGNVYLTPYPGFAKAFGGYAYPEHEDSIAVYDVAVKVKDLHADKDQLKNKRMACIDLGDSLAASMLVGHSATVKHNIENYDLQPHNTYHVMRVYLDVKRPFEITDSVKDIYTEIKEKLDTSAMRGLTLIGLNGKQMQVGEYIDVIKAVDDLIEHNPVAVNGQIAHDEELQVYHPKDRLQMWREHEISRISGMGTLPMSWQVVISEQIGSHQFTAAAIQDGYDGVIVTRSEDYKEYVAFEPSQIKSATMNVGCFSKESNDIRYQSADRGTHELTSILPNKNDTLVLLNPIALDDYVSVNSIGDMIARQVINAGDGKFVISDGERTVSFTRLMEWNQNDIIAAVRQGQYSMNKHMAGERRSDISGAVIPENVRIYENNGNLFVKCRINGREQLSQKMSVRDAADFRQGKADKTGLVRKYFSRALDAGMKKSDKTIGKRNGKKL